MVSVVPLTGEHSRSTSVILAQIGNNNKAAFHYGCCDLLSTCWCDAPWQGQLGSQCTHRPVPRDGLGFSVGQRQRYITVAEVCGLGANIPGLDLVGWGRWASSQRVLAISDGLGLPANEGQCCIVCH